MRNRISCSAQSLAQLQPDMIRSVVGGQVYGLGNQYFSESRVQVLETGDGLVSAEVSGTFGVYTQTIKLRSGVLSTKCSCPSNEKPFCRHCVAVLLQHYKERAKSADPVHEADHPVSTVQEESRSDDSASTDFNFRDVTAFVDWMQSCVKGLGRDSALPALPKLPAGAVKGWSEAIDSLHRQFLESEGVRMETQVNLQAAQEQIVGFTQALEEARREAKDAHGACGGLQAEIKKYQESLRDFDTVRQERDRLAQQIKKVHDELQGKSAELSGISEAISNLTKNMQ
ncbi:MAG: SWIM zinc finger family protein [Nitrospirales bacterium]